MYKTILSLLLVMSSQLSLAEAVSKSYWGSVAIGGMDTVAYHQRTNRANHTEVQGQKIYVVKWKDANWHFATQASADKFAANPEKYRPEYNGHCANALSLGEGLIPTDGSVWEFFGDELHLFYAERGRQRWLKGDWKTYKQQANQAWTKLKNEG